MGQLFGISDFNTSEKSRGWINTSWYFSDVYHHHGSGGPWWKEIKIEADFPHSRAIHWKWFGEKERNPSHDQRRLRIDIRRFVERRCLGCAVFTFVDLSYEYLYAIPEKYRDRYGEEWRREKIEHGYMVFNFEEADDAVLFALTFAGFVSEVDPRHPDRTVPEEQIEHAARERWKGERW